MSGEKLLGPLCLVALLFGAAAGGLAGAVVSVVSELQALLDPKFASWGSGAPSPVASAGI